MFQWGSTRMRAQGPQERESHSHLRPIWMFNVALPLRRVAALPSRIEHTYGRCYARDVTEWGLANIGPCTHVNGRWGWIPR